MWIEIAYATPDEQVIEKLSVTDNCTVATAIKQSTILSRFPEINLAQAKVGIFSKKVSLDYILHDGDRIEIYRELTIDPMTARRLRAEKKAK